MTQSQLNRQKYRDYLTKQLDDIDELFETPSSKMTMTLDTVVNAMRLQFEIVRELYRLDNENRQFLIDDKCNIKPMPRGGVDSDL